VIQKSSINVYQQMFSFLLQTCRAKSVLQQTMSRNPSHPRELAKLALYLRQRLIWFSDIMRSYLLETIILQSSTDLKQELQKADDIDAMAAAHERYVSRLQTQCLLSKNLAPIHQAIVSLLDLAVSFSDAEKRNLQIALPSPQRKPGRSERRSLRKSAKVHENFDSFSEDDAEEDDYEGDEDDMSPQQASYEESLVKIKEQFDRLLPFVAAGLRGVSRGGTEPCWEALAQRLGWGVS
jgi:gamma-tubulin complex component 5